MDAALVIHVGDLVGGPGADALPGPALAICSHLRSESVDGRSLALCHTAFQINISLSEK